MASPWLPVWLGVTLGIVFAVILIVHLWHVVVLAGRDRLWHCVHVLTATGMLVMFAPPARMVVSNGVGMVVFAAAAVIVGCLLVRERAHRQNVGELWFVIVIDLAAMVYMFVMMSTRFVWLTISLVGWFVPQAGGWGTGRLYAVLAHGGLGGPRPASVPASALTAASAEAAPTASGIAGERPDHISGHHTHRDAAHRTVIRATLALMGVGMASMLIAIQFGMATMAGM